MSTPRFLSDEDFRGRILRAALRLEPAMQISRVVDVGLDGATDDQVLDYATANQLLLVSHDESTMKPLAEERVRGGLRISGLLMVPQDSPPRMVAESLVLIWAASQTEDWENLVIYLPF